MTHSPYHVLEADQPDPGEQAIEAARELGRGHGDAMGQIWSIEGRDPEAIPEPDLSGQWADGWTPRDLAAHVGMNDGDISWNGPEFMGWLCDAYEAGFAEAVAKYADYRQEQ